MWQPHKACESQFSHSKNSKPLWLYLFTSFGKKSILHISAGKQITPPPSATWSRALHSWSTRWVKALKQEQKELCSYPTVLPRGESYPAMYCNAEPKEQPNQRLCYASVSVRTKILCFTATVQLYACLSNGGITVISQNCPWKVIISDLTIRFALYAVLKIVPERMRKSKCTKQGRCSVGNYSSMWTRH